MREITAADLGERPCMVVAHPDDECLWAGGLLARFRHLGWTVICCSTPRRDPVRAERFYAACEALGAKKIGCSLTVEGEPGWPIPDLDDMLIAAFRKHEPDCVVTHGAWGEYGHNQHIQVHMAVANNHNGRILGFGWSPVGTLHKNYSLELTMTPDELALKRKALDCYGEKADALRQRYYKELGVPEDMETYDAYRL